MDALATATQIRNPWYQAIITNFVANIESRLGDPVAALERYHELLTEMIEMSNYGTAGATLRRVACCLGRVGSFDTALAAITAAAQQAYSASIAPDLAAQIAELEVRASATLPPATIVEARTRGARWSITDAVRACLDEIDRVLDLAG